MQRERQPNLPLLYSLQGYQWCDLKLAQGRAGEVAARYKHFLAWRQPGDSLLDHALEELAAGRAAHAAALSPASRGMAAIGGAVANTSGRS